MAVGAEVALPAPVVGDDVAGPRVLGAHDLEPVVALLGIAHPRLHGGPAAARHLVPGLLERPRHERRAPRVAGRDLRRSEVLLDLRPAVRAAGLLDPLLRLGVGERRGPERAATSAGRSDGGGHIDDAGRRGCHGRAPGQQVLGLRELLLVAVAILLGRPLDVGDPLPVGVRVIDRLARRQPLRLDLLGGVQEPLDLQLGVLGVAGVLALVPDPDAHLEEPDRVGVAEVEVLHPRLDERGHQRQLGWQAALLRLSRHPGRDLLLRRVVAGIGVGRGRGDGGDRRPARLETPQASAARRPSGTTASRGLRSSSTRPRR